MSYLLNVAYLVLLVALSPWLAWSAIRRGKYRKGWSQKLLGRLPVRRGSGPCIWLHAVSVGEVQMLSVLLDRIATRWPDCECVVSTTTNSGYDLAKRRYAEHTVCYCPLDFSWAVRTALRRVRPTLLVLVELELWPNLISEASRREIHVAVVNGRLSSKSYRGYARLRWLAQRMLSRLSLIAVQNEEYAGRFRNLGAAPDSVHITGSLKFDGAVTDRQNPRTKQLQELAGLCSEHQVLLVGSTQEPEEAMGLERLAELAREFPQLRLVVVPRHPHRFTEVANLLDASGLGWRRRGELTGGEPFEEPVLLVDTVGELAAWWGTADIAFVGGSMGSRGGQNMIEPAAFGAALSFGPNTRNFRDIVELLLCRDAAVVVRDSRELTAFVRRCLSDRNWSQKLGAAASQVVLSQQGAADRTVELLSKLIETPAGRRAAA